MALSGSAIGEIRTQNGSDNNAGLFCLGGNTYSVTDLASSNGTNATPTVTSTTYTFVAGDVDSYLWVASGTNWTPGLRKITSVSAGAATVSGAVGTAASLTGGSASIDRSQQNGSWATGTNLTVDATTNTDVAPDGYTPTAMDVGDVIKITTTGGGAAFTIGRYQVTRIVGGKWRLDRSPAATSSAGATWFMGGAAGGAITSLDGSTTGTLIESIKTNGAGGVKIFVKGENTVASTATNNLSCPSVTPSRTQPANHLIGYTTTRGDSGKVTVQATTNSGITCLLATTGGWIIENFIGDGNNLTTSTSFNVNPGTANYLIRNVKAMNFKTLGIGTSGGPNPPCIVVDCEVTGGGAGCTGISVNNSGHILRNHVHDNAGVGISVSGGIPLVAWNLVVNNTGASSDGIAMVVPGSILNNTISGNGRDGIRYSGSTAGVGPVIRNNLIAGHTNAINFSAGAGAPASALYDGNAFWNNTNNRVTMDDLSSNLEDAVVPYTNVLDVILSADPFTNAAGGDWTLNNTAGGGAAARAAGTPGALPGISQTGKVDHGALQHTDSGGSSGSPRFGLAGPGPSFRGVT